MKSICLCDWRFIAFASLHYRLWSCRFTQLMVRRPRGLRTPIKRDAFPNVTLKSGSRKDTPTANLDGDVEDSHSYSHSNMELLQVCRAQPSRITMHLLPEELAGHLCSRSFYSRECSPFENNALMRIQRRIPRTVVCLMAPGLLTEKQRSHGISVPCHSSPITPLRVHLLHPTS